MAWVLESSDAAKNVVGGIRKAEILRVGNYPEDCNLNLFLTGGLPSGYLGRRAEW